MQSKVLGFGVVACLVFGGSRSIALAQSARRLEVGTDAQFVNSTYSLNTPSGGALSGGWAVSFPLSNLRLAFPIGRTMALEPAVSYGHTKTLGTELGLTFDLTSDPNKSQWFLRPAVGWQHSGSIDRATLGAGVGLRLPVTNSISTRFETRYQYLTRTNGVSGNVVGLFAGVSVFTR